MPPVLYQCENSRCPGAPVQRARGTPSIVLARKAGESFEFAHKSHTTCRYTGMIRKAEPIRKIAETLAINLHAKSSSAICRHIAHWIVGCGMD
jgi:hypothetical protein